jgi:hypothetical protein
MGDHQYVNTVYLVRLRSDRDLDRHGCPANRLNESVHAAAAVTLPSFAHPSSRTVQHRTLHLNADCATSCLEECRHCSGALYATKALDSVRTAPHLRVMSSAPPLGPLLGTIEISVLVSSVLYGVICVQTYFYAHTRSFESDGRILKLLVAAIWCVVSSSSVHFNS